MSYKETDFQSMFTKWVRENYPSSAVFELKLVKGKSLAYSSFQPQQLPSLRKAKHSCVYKKLSDLDPSMKPWDCFIICNADAYVVVMFYEKRKRKTVYLVDIDDFDEMAKANIRKSATEEMLRKAATFIVNF